jgi:hypothetical protein
VTGVGRRAARLLAVLLIVGAVGCTTRTIVALPPLDLVIGSGDGQFGVVGSLLPAPLRVVVQTAASGLPRRGVGVMWDVTQGDATLVGQATTVSDSTGFTEIRVRLGANPGTVTVRARITEQPNVTAEFQVFAVTQPTVTALTPPSAAAGDTITLTGTSFSPVPDQNVVLFSGVRGRVVSAASTSLDVIVPSCLPAIDTQVTMQLGVVASADTTLFTSTGGTVFESMSVGDVIDVTDEAGFDCFALPDAAGATYLTIVYSASTVGAALHPYRFTALPSTATFTAPPRAIVEGPRFDEGTTVVSPQAVWDQRLREMEADLVRGRAASRRTSSGPALTSPAAVVPVEGQVRTFSVLNAQGGFDQVGAVAQWVGTRAAIFVDTLAPANGFNLGELATFAGRFDQAIHPQVTSAFGAASDLDTNERIVILFTPAVNRLTPVGASGFIGGFFYGVDLLPGATGSNNGEVFYALVPDPTGIHSGPRSKALVASVVPAILAHEFQHMVHFNERILVRGAPAQEALWLSEALAQMAEEIVARAYAVLGDSASDSLFRSGTRDRARRYLQQTDTVSVIVTTGQGSLPERGAGFLNLLYVDDRFGGDVLRRLTQTTRTGVGNVEAEVGLPWTALLADWWSATYTDGVVPSGPQYPDVNLRGFLGTPYPLARTLVLGGGLDATGSLWSSSAAYFMVDPASGESLTIRLGGEAGGPSPAQSVLRMRIIRVT